MDTKFGGLTFYTWGLNFYSLKLQFTPVFRLFVVHLALSTFYLVIITHSEMHRTKTFEEQECIPAGCVPPACCPYLPACTGPGGCTWSRGVYLVLGRGLGCTWSRGVYLVGGGGEPGPGGVYLPRYSPAAIEFYRIDKIFRLCRILFSSLFYFQNY